LVSEKMAKAFKTKSMIIYEKLRQGIIKGRYKPGQRLVLAEQARLYGSSQTPVREAIRRLESEGYVIFNPHLGAVVAQIEEHELTEIYLIRSELEALAIRLAIPHLSSRDIDWLKKKNQDMESAIERNQLEYFARLNRAFHLRIYSVAPYPRLYKLINDLWDSFEHWSNEFLYVPDRAMASVEEHKKIIEGLETKDSERAVEFMRLQKERALRALQNYLTTSNFTNLRNI
ncbi:MAG: GntR family transcriptional regulator, partial [Smithellaceae bacterium]|nr:GntR family transcriptional regulator [Smithellaceae bacterium]